MWSSGFKFFCSSFLILVVAQTSWAQAAAAAQPSLFESLIPIFGIFLVFYFLVIRPQSKQRKEHQAFLDGLKKGDQVVTSGGILGQVKDLTQDFITLEIANGVNVKMRRSHVAGSFKETVKA